MLGHIILGIVKSDLPKYKGKILKVICGCRFPGREIEEPIVESSSGQWKKKILCTWTFRPADWGGCITPV